ncbi:DUF3127 domain-containing protein [Flavobacterium selenitireducens]|uniref:DUF3127 domain-containing protein n=1 Tax=Flavobacterium selenitireducens TaxID=2722704 RepID=UPI00168B68BA|nr:DUF3127 domain-containing protein [Flavobacterium selenitireducens]MBD3582334.1 DUF3127 domain-containing protein [Flavobacterium selenitireducens]
MEVTGKIRVINPTQQVSASFKKRELVVTTDEQYPQHIMVEFTQDKTDMLDSYRPGEDVKVSINLRGREWVSPQGETRYFNTIQGWRIERVQADAPQQYQQQPQYPQQPPQFQQQAPQAPSQPFAPAPNFNEEEHDDLPF